ncbi:cytochrome C oxidase subunit IV family protein [uncultured Jannaschia sp.]|uniref:cytochrome C oxidase subunit IV family protein n=1 Tax=uncultured Jannaschia sp. TaxID=293347 RepID=UPI0026289653|nr:cytochrome C oxidase subunit IV family protein [uncultured Jannaschia sp.]
MSGRGERAGRLWLRAGLVWLALTGLLAATILGAYLPLGTWKLPVALGIAALKAGLVGLVFMEFASARAITRFAALSGFLFAALLMAIVFLEEATRSHLTDTFPAAARATPD